MPAHVQRESAVPKPTAKAELSRLVSRLVPGLELVAQVAEEASGKRAVDEAMVVRERQVHDRPDGDHVLAELVLHDPGAFHHGVRAENRCLRLADHGRPVERAVAAGVRDRERPTREPRPAAASCRGRVARCPSRPSPFRAGSGSRRS